MTYLNIPSRERAILNNFSSNYIFDIISNILIDRLKILLLDPKNIIEIGSFSEILTQKLQKLYPHSKITICEPSLKNLNLFPKKYLYYHMQNQQILLPPYSFDLLVSSLYLHRVVDKKIFIQNLKLLLSNKKYGLIAFPGGKTLLNLKKFFIKKELELGLPSVNHILPMIDIDEIQRIAVELNLSNIVLDSSIIQGSYMSIYHLIKDIQLMGESFNNYNNYMPRKIIDLCKYSGRFDEEFEIIFLTFTP